MREVSHVTVGATTWKVKQRVRLSGDARVGQIARLVLNNAQTDPEPMAWVVFGRRDGRFIKIDKLEAA